MIEIYCLRRINYYFGTNSFVLVINWKHSMTFEGREISTDKIEWGKRWKVWGLEYLLKRCEVERMPERGTQGTQEPWRERRENQMRTTFLELPGVVWAVCFVLTQSALTLSSGDRLPMSRWLDGWIHTRCPNFTGFLPPKTKVMMLMLAPKQNIGNADA